jgi:Uma2 family endonuclease
MDVAHRLPVDLEPALWNAFWGTLTWEEYLAFEAPPGFRFEFDEGRLIVSPTGKNLHGRTLVVLAGLLWEYEKQTGGQHCAVFVEQSCFMPPGARDLRPDVAVVTDARREGLDPDGYIEGAPNIAVEVLSPRTRALDRGLKAVRYYEQGAEELWLFDPAAGSVEFCRRGADGWQNAHVAGQAYETPLLPGFGLELTSFWEAVRRPLKRK